MDRYRSSQKAAAPVAAVSSYTALGPQIAAATAVIAASPTRTPPSLAEGVALMGLLTNPRHHARVLRDMRLWSAGMRLTWYTLPMFLVLKCRGLRRGVIEISWHYARVTAPRRHIDPATTELVPPPLRRATECWAMMLIAGETVHDILNLSAWSDRSLLDEQNVRIDLAASLHHVGAQLFESARLANELGEPPTGTSPESAHTRNVINQQTAGLDIVRESVSRHITALGIYRDRLTAVDVQHQLVHHVEGLDDQIAELVYRSGGADIPTADLTAAATTLFDALRARSQALAHVRGDYLHALNLD